MADRHIEGDHNVVGSSIQANGDVMVGSQKTTNIYFNANYQELTERIAELEEDLAEIPLDKLERRLQKSEKLEALREREQAFRQEIIRLAETFTRIPINTERLKQAKAQFEQGQFKAADALLTYHDIKGDQDQLLAARQRNEAEKQSIDTALANNANEFLIKAQTTALDYENPQRFEDSCRYFEASIQSKENEENLFAYAYFLQEHKQNNQAQSYYERYLELFRAQLSQVQLAAVLNNLGNLHSARGEYTEEEKSLQEALEIRKELAQANPQVYLPDVAGTLINMGAIHRKLAEYVEAKRHYREALTIQRELAHANPQIYLAEVGKSLSNLGNLQSDRKEYEQAKESFQESLEIQVKLAKVNPNIFLPDVATTLINWASLNQKLGNQDSLGQIKEGLKILAPFVARMPFAREVVKAAFGVLLAWDISPIDFIQGQNLPLDLLIFTSSSSGPPS